MKTVFFFVAAIVSFTTFGCSKDNQKTVFKAKYIGRGCWDVIQILEPYDRRFSESSWMGNNDSTYTGAVSVGELSEEYRSGEPFYLTIKSVKLVKNIPHRDICSLPKYGIEIDSCSDIPIATN
jgi:hypothetical protein